MKFYQACGFASKANTVYISTDRDKLMLPDVGIIFSWAGPLRNIFSYIFDSGRKVRVVR